MGDNFIHHFSKNTSHTFLKIALVGNPNSGKSTLFNALTGLNQKTGNFPGVTVEKKTGITHINSPTGETITAEFIDLPGIYSLQVKSIDGQVAVNAILDSSNTHAPDLIVIVADASNLKRNLFLATQIIELRKPVILVLNMIDLIEEKGVNINTQQLSEKLGVKIIAVNARQKKGIEELKKAIADKIVVSDKNFINKTKSEIGETQGQAEENISRYRVITEILHESITTSVNNKESFTNRLDKILTHRIWGFIIFLGILFLLFQTIFFLAAYPMDWIETSFVKLSEWGTNNLPKGELTALLINGILAGLSGVIVFVPQIALLFAFIAILEDTGYMARVSFIMDKLMRKFGLNGKSVIPLISGVACAVPAIMSTRTISNWKERMITMMVTPLMSCSARLPVYTLLISLVIPTGTTFLFFNMQGLILLILYLIGFIAAIGSAWVLKLVLKAKEKSYFIMEMPVYRMPKWSTVGLVITDKVKVFLFDAGKIIIAISIILWVLSSHAPGNRFMEIEKKYSLNNAPDPIIQKEREQIIASEKLQVSYAGILGKAIEPAIAPLGFDWKIGISLITSFAAREVFVGTMATIYSVGNESNTQSIREKMMNEINPDTGQKRYTIAVGFSLMIFYAFAMQCMSTLAVVYRETKKWKWPFIQFVYMGVLAYFSSFLVFHLLK